MKSIKLEKIYTSKTYDKDIELKVDEKNNNRPSWVEVKVDPDVIFIKILFNGEAFWYRRYFRDYFFPLEHTSKDYELYYDKIAKDYESFVPQNKDIAKFLISVLNEFKVDKKSNILDVGAGTGLVTEHLAKEGYNKLTLLDISGEELEVAKSKVQLKNANFQRVDLTREGINGKYDFAFETMALDYFKGTELTSILNKIKKSLKNQGMFIAIDRHIPKEFDEIFTKIKRGSIKLSTPEGSFDYYYFVGKK